MPTDRANARPLTGSAKPSFRPSLRAKRSNPSCRKESMDCFVASLLAMTTNTTYFCGPYCESGSWLGIANALRTLLLAEYSGPRRICSPRAGGCRRKLCRCRAQRSRHGGHDCNDGGAQRHAAVRPAVSQSRPAGDRTDRQHPALSRVAPWSGAEGGGGAAVAAPIAAYCRGSGAGSSRHPSSARPLAVLRGSARAGEKTRRRILEGAGAEISWLFRAAAEKQRWLLSHRAQAYLRASLIVSDRGAPA